MNQKKKYRIKELKIAPSLPCHSSPLKIAKRNPRNPPKQNHKSTTELMTTKVLFACGAKSQCVHRESNPSRKLGKLACYHYTMYAP